MTTPVPIQVFIFIPNIGERRPGKGYEAQVNNTHKDPKKTGGLYAVKDNLRHQLAIMMVRLQHNRSRAIQIKINGKTITDYTEPEGLNRPVANSTGTFALQAHDQEKSCIA